MGAVEAVGGSDSADGSTSTTPGVWSFGGCRTSSEVPAVAGGCEGFSGISTAGLGNSAGGTIRATEVDSDPLDGGPFLTEVVAGVSGLCSPEPAVFETAGEVMEGSVCLGGATSVTKGVSVVFSASFSPAEDCDGILSAKLSGFSSKVADSSSDGGAVAPGTMTGFGGRDSAETVEDCPVDSEGMSTEPSETCSSEVGVVGLPVFAVGRFGAADVPSSSRRAEVTSESLGDAAGFVTGFSVDSIAGERG